VGRVDEVVAGLAAGACPRRHGGLSGAWIRRYGGRAPRRTRFVGPVRAARDQEDDPQAECGRESHTKV
jgi:hypothetical protein